MSPELRPAPDPPPAWDGGPPPDDSDAPSELAEGQGTAPPDEQGRWEQPRPLPDERPPVDPFDPALLPAAFRPWIVDVAERMSCPPDFPAAGAMVALGAVVGRQIAIRPKRHDDWTVVPNLWGCIVGRPSALKSPALEEAMGPVKRLSARAWKEGQEALEAHEAGRLVREMKAKVFKKELESALKPGGKGKRTRTLDEIQTDLADLEAENKPPTVKRYHTSDSTVEKLEELLRDNPNGLLVVRDELMGWLKTLDKHGRESDRAFYLEGWSGLSSHTTDRVGRGTVDVPAVCVSILGGIQPGPLAAYVRDATAGGSGDDGLLQRFQVLVYPDDPKEWVNVDRWPDAAARGEASAVFERLADLAAHDLQATVDGEGQVPFLRFDGEAQELFNDWRERLERRLRQRLPPVLEAHLAKYRSLVPSLALLSHLADGGTGPVNKLAMARGEAWAEFLESHARRMYADALQPEVRPARTLARRLRAGDVGPLFTARDIKRRHWARLDGEAVDRALPVLEVNHWIRGRDQKGQGRPSRVYEINPRIGEVAT